MDTWRWMLLTGLLAGCAGDTTASLESRLAPLVGAPEAALAQRIGPPTLVQEDGAERQVVYREGWPVNGNLNYPNGPYPTPPDRFCEITFQVRQGLVAGYALRGATCGWGGRPLVRPA